jgi:hypothetical protein
MSVELVVCLPVILMILFIAVNLLLYLDACAKFDRIAAEAVRIEASSPGYGGYDSGTRAANVRNTIIKAHGGIDGRHIALSVDARFAASYGGGQPSTAPTLPMTPFLETYTCEMTYYPLGPKWAFGASLPGFRHSRSYTVDPFRPGVFL